MQKHFLTVANTARYFTKGNLDKNTENIWIIIHGYAQTADTFLKSFEIVIQLGAILAVLFFYRKNNPTL
jgi:hypothetical protein